MSNATATQLVSPSGKKLVVEYLDVAPEIAEKMLFQNPNNRDLRGRWVDTLTQHMNNGAWREGTGEAIQFDRKGNLINGQHRLHAIIKSGKTFPFLIVSELGLDVMRVLDNIYGRNVNCYLEMRGEQNVPSLSSALKILWMYKNDRLTGYGDTIAPSNEILGDLLDANPGLCDSVELGLAFRGQDFRCDTFLMFLHYVGSEKHPEKADEFIQKLSTGAGLEVGSPIYVLREYLMKERNSAKRITVKHRRALITKAWNAHLKGEKMNQLNWRSKGKTKDRFPSIMVDIVGLESSVSTEDLSSKTVPVPKGVGAVKV